MLIFPIIHFNFLLQLVEKNRLDIFGTVKKRQIVGTDYHEIIKIIGCLLVMAYNRLPYFSMYFSRNKSLGNDLIKSAFSRDRYSDKHYNLSLQKLTKIFRFLLLWSKLYFNNPVKPANASKTYYMDEFMNFLKFTFTRARSELSFQSIDETMVKCKGRTSMKQHITKKPIRDGVKCWHRCDTKTGYSYVFNVYQGREESFSEGTLGERVVKKLCATIRSPHVAIFMDRFFTSVELMKTLPFACVGTVMPNLKNVP